MPPPPPPSRVDPIQCPVFALTWIGPSPPNEKSPIQYSSVLAYGGGGGSARTGVSNKIIILSNSYYKQTNHSIPQRWMTIDTGDQICVGMNIYYPFMQQEVWLLAAVGNNVNLYNVVNGKLLGSITCGNEGVNTVTFQPDGKQFVAGCENGNVLLYSIHNINSKEGNDGNGDGDMKYEFKLLIEYSNHMKSTTNKKAICSVCFAPPSVHHEQSFYFLTAAKDGTARVWSTSDNKELALLKCSLSELNAPAKPAPKPAPKQQVKTTSNRNRMMMNPPVYVRGCSFGFNEETIYTIQNGRKGKSYASKWRLTTIGKEKKYVEEIRTSISPTPVSAMCISGDRSFLALGTVGGSIYIYDSSNLSLIRLYEEVHDLPVTCIAAIPWGMHFPEAKHPLQQEQDGGDIEFCAISASADNRLAFLTLQKLPMSTTTKSLLLFLSLILILLAKLIKEECGDELLETMDMDLFVMCVRVSMIATSGPGISFVPI